MWHDVLWSSFCNMWMDQRHEPLILNIQKTISGIKVREEMQASKTFQW